MEPRRQIVFDTDCVLCSGFVHFILRHERSPTLQFVGAWSPTGLKLASAHGLTRNDLNETVLVVENGRAYTKSDAALVIAGQLKWPLSWFAALRIVPRPFRDRAYTFVARRRYRWFGKRSTCFMPPAQAAERFINS